MHPNPAFRKTPAERNLDFARARGFGTLSVNGAEGPVMAHVPFLLSPDGGYADLHLARSNAVIVAGLPAKAVLAVTGADAYISPDWYGVPDQVPTWNYIAVHLRGELVPMPLKRWIRMSMRCRISSRGGWHPSRSGNRRRWARA